MHRSPISSVAILSEVSEDTWCLTSIETIRLIRDGEKGGGKGVWRWGKREVIIDLLVHCHHQNDSCIRMDSEER